MVIDVTMVVVVARKAQWWLGYDDTTVVAKHRGWVRHRYSSSEAQRIGTTTLQ